MSQSWLAEAAFDPTGGFLRGLRPTRGGWAERQPVPHVPEALRGLFRANPGLLVRDPIADLHRTIAASEILPTLGRNDRRRLRRLPRGR